MRKVILFLPLLVSFQYAAQNGPKAALTAGTDTYMPYQGEGASITQDQSVALIPFQPEDVISQGTAKVYPEPKSTTSKDIIVLFAGLLIATAIYFMFRKNSEKHSAEIADIRMEDENAAKLKKEMWDNMAVASEEEPK